MQRTSFEPLGNLRPNAGANAADAGSTTLVRSDALGLAILATLGIVAATVDFPDTASAVAFIDYICRTLDLPMGFAETGWDLRLSTEPFEEIKKAKSN